MGIQHFLSIDDLSREQLDQVLANATKFKEKRKAGSQRLRRKQIALIFEKPSTRTRVSFEAAISKMGGHGIVLRSDELQLGRGETIEDTARVLSGYVDAIVVRTFEQERLLRLAEAASVPVVNALSDSEHPCQALADLFTIQEHVEALEGTDLAEALEGTALAYIGDGNNVAHSLLLAGAKFGMDVRVATPKGYEPSSQMADRAREIAAQSGAKITVTDVVAEAVVGASFLYTDVWASMGQESSAEERKAAFEKYQVTTEMVEMAEPDARVMHCLPAHRGEEIAAEVIDGPRSIVWDQAENRLHTQKGLLAFLLS